MSTFYFRGTEDNDWDTSDNWWDAPSGGNQGFNPTSTDDVVILAQVDNAAAPPGVSSVTIGNGGNITSITVYCNTCTIGNGGRLTGSIVGNVVCNSGGLVSWASNATGSVSISGDLSFYGSGGTDAGVGYEISVTGNLYLQSNWSGTAGYITAGSGLVIYYGSVGSYSNLTINGSTYYANYPTLYFNAAVDDDWNNHLNWWVNSSFDQQSFNVPNSTNNVFIVASCLNNSGGMPTVANLTMDDPFVVAPILSLTTGIVVTNTATFNDQSINASYINYESSFVTAIFNDSAQNSIYNPNSTIGYIKGYVTFNNSSSNYLGAVAEAGSTATFNDSSYNEGTVGYGATADFYDTSYYKAGGYNGAIYSFYDNSYTDSTAQNSDGTNFYFYDNSHNLGTIGIGYFHENSTNPGYVTSSCTCTYPLNRNTFNTGTINGSLSYASYPTFYRHNGSWYEDGAYNTVAAYAPGSLDDVVLREETGYGGETFNNVTIETEFYTGGSQLTVNGTITFTSGGIGNGSSPGVVTAASAIFNNNTLIRSGSTLNVSGVVDFYDTSTNQGGVYSSNAANFRENSENAGYVDYDVHFYDDSTNSGTVNGNASVYYPHPAPFNSFNGNTGTINGTVTHENYVQRTVYFYSSNSANVYCLSCREWSEITNWWDDSAHTIQSAYVPNSILALDIVFVQSSILTNNNNFDINVHTFTVQNTAEVSLSDITCETLTLEANSILGNVTNQYSVNVFTHDAQLNDSSTVAGGVSLFPNLANTNFQFYDYSSNYGTVNGANEGYVNFFDSSSNHGLVISTNAANNAVGFYNLSSNFGTANANVAVYSPHPAPFDSNNLNTGTVNGEITYFDYTQRTVYFYSPNSANTEWGNVANWWNDSSYTIQSTYVPNSTLALDIVYVHSNIWYNSFANANVYSMTINDAADVSIDVYCDTLTLNNTASFGGNNNQATAFTTNTEFNDDSNNRGIVVSATPVAFRDSSINGPGTVVYDAGFYNTSTQQSNGAVSGNVIVYHPHAVPFNADNGNLGSIGGSLTYSNYSPRTVYFYSANSTAWGNLSNWWSDSSHTTQASYVPFSNISIDTVVIDSSVDSFTLGDYDATVGLLTVNSCDLSIDVTCYFHALFNGSASFGASNSSVILTQLNGSGDASIRFSDLSINYATINNSYNGFVIHPVVFEDSSSQQSSGTITSDVNVYYPVALPMDGTILGTTTYYGSYPKYFNNGSNWANTGSWFLDSSSTIPAGSVPTETYPGENVIIQTSIDSVSEGTPTAYNLSLINAATSISGITVAVNGLATIENNSFLGSGATIAGDALFKTEGYNNGGTVNGTATFDLSSAKIMILNGFDGTYSGNVEFQYGKGVNGSSILGIV